MNSRVRSRKPDGRRLLAPAPVRRRDDANKHAIRKRETRARLLKAASQLAGEGRLFECGLDDLCQVAGISRAGFYLHFPNKGALLEALQLDMCDWYSRQFRKLDAEVVASPDHFVAWLQECVRGFEAVKDAIILFNYRGSTLSNQGSLRRNAAVLELASKVPAFRVMREDGSVDDERRIELLLLIFQIEQLCLHVVLHSSGNDDLPLKVLARKFREFMAS